MQRLVIALTALLVIAGVTALALFVFVLGATSDRAAALAPADTVAYANVYLQPSTTQQTRLGGLIGRLPGFADTAALDEKIDQVAQNLLSGAGIDYRDQLKPWLGDQLAVAVWPAPGGEPAMAVLVSVKDREAAAAALTDLATERDGGEPQADEHDGIPISVSAETSWAFVEELLVAAPAIEAVEAVIDVAAGESSLADADGYRDAMSDMPNDHLASVYVDLPRLGQLAGSDAAVTGWRPAGAVLVAEEDGLRLEGSAAFDGTGGEDAQTSTLAEWMPADTQAQITLFGLRALIEEAEAVAAETEEGQELTDALDGLRTAAAFGLGIDLDEDVLPLLDGPVAVAVRNVGDTVPGLQVLLQPPDADAAGATLGRIADGLRIAGASITTERIGDGTEVVVVSIPNLADVAYAVVDGVVVAGLTVDDLAAAIDAHDGGASLAQSDAYQRTFGLAGERAGSEIFVDVGAVVEATGAADELPADARDILHEIGTFGLTAASRDDRLDFRAVLTVE